MKQWNEAVIKNQFVSDKRLSKMLSRTTTKQQMEIKEEFEDEEEDKTI
jgi:hypothetical protein